MKTFVVTAAAVNFPSGSVLALDADQVRRRRHALADPSTTDLADLDIDNRAVKAGKLTVMLSRQKLTFKQGETVSVISAPGVNFDRISEMAPTDSEKGEAAIAEEKSRRAARSKKRASAPSFPASARKKAVTPESTPENDTAAGADPDDNDGSPAGLI